MLAPTPANAGEQADARYEQFTAAVRIYAEQFRIITPDVEVSGDEALANVAISNPTVPGAGIHHMRITVRKDFIETATAASVEHIAAREVCAIWLRHFAIAKNPRERALVQLEADGCAFDLVGLDIFVSSVQSIANHGVGYLMFANANEDQIREAVVRSIGASDIELRTSDHATAPIGVLVDALIRYHEEHLGIRYMGDAPKIVWIADPTVTEYAVSGYYTHQTRTIALHPAFRGCDARVLLEHIEDRLHVAPVNECDMREFREVLSHELGHHYVGLVLDQTKRSWLKPLYSEDVWIDPLLLVASKFVNEGIGMYFGMIFPGDVPPPYAFSANPQFMGDSEESFMMTITRYIYDSGWRMVHPILHGRVEAGVKWLIEHELVLTNDSFAPAINYRKRALKALGGVTNLP